MIEAPHSLVRAYSIPKLIVLKYQLLLFCFLDSPEQHERFIFYFLPHEARSIPHSTGYRAKIGPIMGQPRWIFVLLGRYSVLLGIFLEHDICMCVCFCVWFNRLISNLKSSFLITGSSTNEFSVA